MTAEALPQPEPGHPLASASTGSEQSVPTAAETPAAKAGGSVGRVGGALGVAGLLAKLWASAKVLTVLFKFKTALTMLVSVGAYALLWGWQFALGFVLLIFVHEMGHVVVLRAQGIKASAPMFIPFLGAFIKVEQPQRSVAQEATSALAGPAIGALAAGATYGIAITTGSQLLQALAYTGFLLNLFNLLPMLPLDGGRVAGAIHPGLWWIGLAAVVGLMFVSPSPVLVFVVILGGVELFQRWRQRRAGISNAYYSIAPRVRGQIGLAYLVVGAVCLYGMHVAYLPR